MKLIRTSILSLLWMLALLLFSLNSLAQTVSATSERQPSMTDHSRQMQQLLDQGLQLAGPSPGREKTVYAQAMKVRRALARNDFAQANAVLQQSLSHSGFHGGQFQPFAALVWQVAKPGGGVLATHLDAWVKAAPQDAMPYLLRSVYLYQKGWRIRGNRFANDVLRPHMQAFHRELRLAAADAKQALRLAPENPYANYLSLWIASGNGISPSMQRVFAQAQARFPQYYALYRLMLHDLAPKWGGSVAAMYAFVDRYVAPTADDSDLRLLYLQLFAHLLDHAELQCTAPDGNTSQACVESRMGNLVQTKLLQRIDGALQIYPQVQDKVGYSLILGHILKNIADQGGTVAQRYADQFIQRAAAAMGSNTQLSARNTSRNNFVMDRLTGDIWYRQSRYHNAEKLYRRAIADLQHTNFQSPAQMQTQRARLFLRLANLYYQQHDFQKSASYQIAAGYMRGGNGKSGYDPVFCGALYHLGLYSQSVSACRAQLQEGGGYDALYWLARSHEALHQIPRAQALYRQLADSESSYRAYSAIQLSVIHAEHNHLQKMLDTLNAYPWLYHQNTDSSRFDIAAAYNNRCYAELHLGHLHAALQDCQASLRYGNLPDAYAKEQEILKRLHMQGASVAAQGNGEPRAKPVFHWTFWVVAILWPLLTQALSLALSYGLVKWAILRKRAYREQGSPSQVFARIRRWYWAYFIMVDSFAILESALTMGVFSDRIPGQIMVAVGLGLGVVSDLVILVLLLALNQILMQQKLVRNYWGSLLLFFLGAFSYIFVEVALMIAFVVILRMTGSLGMMGRGWVPLDLIPMLFTFAIPLGWL